MSNKNSMHRLSGSIIALLFAFSVYAQSSESRSISYIETTSTWIYIYDESGKLFRTESRSRFGELVGYSSSFFIIKKGSYYTLYDPNCRPLNTILIDRIGEITSVVGDTFTARKGSFITVYDKTGKRLRSKMVQ